MPTTTAQTTSDPRKLGQRLELAFDLFEAGEQIMRQNLKRRHPDADQEEIERRLGEWLCKRPGAEQGDGVGKPVAWPRKAA